MEEETIYLDGIIVHQDFPANTTASDSADYSEPVMSQPLNLTTDIFDSTWKQDLCNVLQNTGQLHVHNDTCFKHLPKSIRALKQLDKDC